MLSPVTFSFSSVRQPELPFYSPKISLSSKEAQALTETYAKSIVTNGVPS